MSKDQLSKTGFGIAIGGAALALLTFLPAYSSRTSVPWPLFIGMMVYLPGAFLCYFYGKSETGRQRMLYLRFVRMSFAVVLLGVLWRMFGSPV